MQTEYWLSVTKPSATLAQYPGITHRQGSVNSDRSEDCP